MITRAEAVSLINRVLGRDPENESDLLENMVTFTDNMNTGMWYYIPIQEAANSHTYERTTKSTEKWVELTQNRGWSAISKI